MIEKRKKSEFELLLDIAYNAAEIYSLTNSNSPEEAVMKLNILGQIDRANQFEKQLKFVNDMYKNDMKILPVSLVSINLIEESIEK